MLMDRLPFAHILYDQFLQLELPPQLVGENYLKLKNQTITLSQISSEDEVKKKIKILQKQMNDIAKSK